MRRRTDKKKSRCGLKARRGRLEKARARVEYAGDMAEARAALAEVAVEGTVLWEQVKAELGL